MRQLTWLLRFALAVLLGTAVLSCGGGGTDDDDGTLDDDTGTDDDASDNPLIAKIPGTWRSDDVPEFSGEITVDETDPDCSAAMERRETETGVDLYNEILHESGDACIHRWSPDPPFIVLDGHTLRWDVTTHEAVYYSVEDGLVSDDGQHMTWTTYVHDRDTHEVTSDSTSSYTKIE